MGWFCENCKVSVLSGNSNCPCCKEYCQNFIPTCSECGKCNETVRNIYIFSDFETDAPLVVCSACFPNPHTL